MLSAYMVLSFYNFYERSEFTSILTSTLTSETTDLADLTDYIFIHVQINYIQIYQIKGIAQSVKSFYKLSI